MATTNANQGTAGYWPWSGNWYPQLDSDKQNMFDDGGALALYDQYVKNTRGYDPGARHWEHANHRTTNEQLDWAGHCHAWAAASVMTKDAPVGGVNKAGVTFSQDALEGLVTELYYNPTFTMLPGGVRSNTDDMNAPEYQDMNPAWMDYLLQYYIRDNKYPIIMDTAAGAQVWNFPAFAYTSTRTAKADGSYDVATRVWFSDAQAGAEATKYFVKDYTYNLRETGDGTMSGQWTGDSVERHPDFAWIPTGKSAEGRNPKVDEAIVEEILGHDV